MKKLNLLFIALFAVAVFTTSCRDEADKMDEKMEDAADDVEDTMEEGANEVKENTGMGGEDDA